MCGIAGIIQTTGSYNAEHLKKMTDALQHRGPDGEGFWQNAAGSVLLGHRRLSIIDLSPEASQPFHYLDRYTVIHNGEIYNYIELREELKKKGYFFRTLSDTEVLAAAFDSWKEKCLERLDGMFAFAIWDEQEKQFFAARDRFGEKPFHYIHAEGKTFLFASEIKAFWPVDQGNQFNQKMLFNFLTIGYTDNPTQPEETFYDEVKKLPPASYLTIKPFGGFALEVHKYWNVNIETPHRTIKDEEAIDQFRDIFTRSVKRRLRSDVPVGTSLSGGLDSSSIAGMERIVEPTRQLLTFSAIFPGFEKNEENHIDEMVSHFSITAAKTLIPDGQVEDLFRKTVVAQDEPFSSASLLPQYSVFGLAKQGGVKVLLDGQGADETLAGYHKYYKWYWQELFRKRKLILSGELRQAKALGIKEKFGINNVIAALFPEFASVFLERQYLLHALRQEDLTKEFVHQQSKEAYYTTPSISSLNGILFFNSCQHGLEELLRYADRNSMAHGVEVRLPFLFHELVEFVFSLPPNFKIRQGWTKWILRKAMEKDLPASITWRENKIGLEPPQMAWMQLPDIQQLIHEAKKKLVQEKILKADVLNKEIRPSSAYEKNNEDWKYLISAQFL